METGAVQEQMETDILSNSETRDDGRASFVTESDRIWHDWLCDTANAVVVAVATAEEELNDAPGADEWGVATAEAEKKSWMMQVRHC
jgi:hypothetical protein